MKVKTYEKSRSALLFAAVLNGSFSALSIVAGFFTGSLALYSNGLHDLSDTVSLSLAFFATLQADRPPDQRRTFGYHRITILVALANSLVLVGLTGVVLWFAFHHFFQPEPLNSPVILAVGAVGVLVNGMAALRLWKEREDLNVKSTFWHVADDVLGSFALVLAGLAIQFTGYYQFDTLLAAFFSLVVLWGAWKVISESLNVILEGVPWDLDLHRIEGELKEVEGVRGIHDLHVWCLGPNLCACSAHILVSDQRVSGLQALHLRIERMLDEKFRVAHATLEFETEGCVQEPGH